MAIKKVKLPNNTVVDINDARIPGVDNTPTAGSSNVVTSGGIATALGDKYEKPATGIPASDIAAGVIPSAPGTLNTTATTAQATSSSEALSGNVTLHKVSKTGSYNDLNNKPTIPSAPGTLITNATTAQTASSGEAMTGNITLHKVSKTGSYSDLVGKPTVDSTPTSGSSNLVSSGGVYSALSGKQATLVSGTNIKTVNNTSLLGSGNITIEAEDGVGFEDVSSQQDGTMVITLTNGDTVTIDLNHTHEGLLPEVTSSDNDKIMKVVSGAWALVTDSGGGGGTGTDPEAVHFTQQSLSASQKAQTKVNIGVNIAETSQPSGGFLPDIVYKLGTLTGSQTFSLASEESGFANQYVWSFTAGSTAPTITWPSNIVWADGTGPTVTAGNYYRIYVMDGVATYLEATGVPTPTPEFHTLLVFDGLAQIQTDIIPQADWSMRVSAGGETRKGVQGIFSARKSGDAVIGMWWNGSSNSSQRVLAARYFSLTTDSDHPAVSGYTTRVGLFITPYRFGYDYTVNTTSSGGQYPDSGIMISAEAGGYYYTGKLGWFYVYGADAKNATNNADLRDNYTPIYTLRPCLYNGEAGYWCVETNTFYGNTAGQGTLSVED